MTQQQIASRIRNLARQADKRAKNNQHLESRLRAEGLDRAYWNALGWIEMMGEAETHDH